MTADARSALQGALRDSLGDPELEVRGVRPVGGGCISPAARLDTSAGAFFAKWSDSGPGDLFEREADGLRALASADSGLAIPEVLAVRGAAAAAPALIVMEFLEPAALDGAALGRGLVALHRHTAPRFGFHTHGYCGSTRQDNEPLPGWPEFYARRRLEPLLLKIQASRGIEPAARRSYDRVLDRLPVFLAHEPAPSLIHGDLWSGNALGSTRGPALVDPACAYADRELELAMMLLFGGFSEACFGAYENAWPLPADWRERVGLYQLYHVLNHFLLFGGHYGPEALALARRYI